MPRRLAPLAFLLLIACGGGGSATPAPPPFVPFQVATFQPASAALGQPDFVSAAPNAGGVDADTANGPTACVEAGGRLWVCDTNNHRVLAFADVPDTTGQAAAFAVGQPDLQSATAATSATLMASPAGITAAGDRLYVSEFGNHRVSIFLTLPGGAGAAATAALGQADLDSATPGTNPSRLRDPVGIHAGGGKLLVADSGNHRVLIWNSLPTVSGQPADLALGQPDRFSGTVNAGTNAGASTMSTPFDVWTDGTRVAVADRGNNRVLLWNTFPTTDGQPADLVLGQPDFVSVDPGGGPSGCRQPSGVTSNGQQLLVADGDNHRILIWDAFPTLDAAPATTVLGQSNFVNTAPNDDDQDLAPDATPSARVLNGFGGFLFIHLDARRAWVGDFRNNRVLRFDGN